MLTHSQKKKKIKMELLSKQKAYQQYKKDAENRHQRFNNQSQMVNQRSKSKSLMKDQKQLPIKEEKSGDERQKCVQQQEKSEQEIEEEKMQKLLGFTTFKSTKNRDHTKSAREGVLKNTQIRRQYRQYKNRRGGMNRNLDKMT